MESLMAQEGKLNLKVPAAPVSKDHLKPAKDLESRTPSMQRIGPLKGDLLSRP